MKKLRTLMDMKEMFQAGFDKNTSLLERFGRYSETQLKAYLIESNLPLSEGECPLGAWESLGAPGWYRNNQNGLSDTFFLDATRERVWIVYSVLDATPSDVAIEKWLKSRRGIDRCWLSRHHLLHWAGRDSWEQRGIGLRFDDGLMPEEEAGSFSLKAWHGATRHIPELEEILKKAKEQFAIYSVRWRKKTREGIVFSSEWYSNGKATINRAEDVDEALISISEIANRYEDALLDATKLRDNTMAAFELDFNGY